MAPPPSTPAPHRFLMPKRSGTQQQLETPQPPIKGSQQFRVTPRFSLPSTPRQPSSTPAGPSAYLPQRQTDIISDIIDSSPPELQPSRILSDSIEIDSIPPSSIVPASDDESADRASDLDEEAPTPKRRRLSVSSDWDLEPVLGSTEDLGTLEDVQPMEEPFSDVISESFSDPYSDGPESPGTSVRQPTFHRAPRFMPVEQPGAPARDPLPDVFSPRRRGARNMPGGLAAEVRDWLIDIEASTGPKRDEDFVAKILVQDVRRSLGMVLIRGRGVTDGALQIQSQEISTSVGIILAGEGRLFGLARRSDVQVGSVVAIAKPVWEVNLDVEGRWAVACDWVVCE